MSLYQLNVGDLPMPSDVNQLINAFNGTHDIGQVSFAPVLSSPSSSSFSLLAQSGGSLSVGAYSYKFSYITGQYKTNNTLNQTGETLLSGSLSITTTSTNKSVNINLPTTSLPTSAVAFGIYRTTVGGSTYQLVTKVKVGNANYIDNASDNNLGGVSPTINTTGTNLSAIVASGNNSNGYYIQYSNGLQLCWMNWDIASTAGMWGTAVVYTQASFYYQFIHDTWTFPSSFVGTVSVVADGDFYNYTAMECHRAYSPSSGQCALEDGVLNEGGADTNAVSLRRYAIAIGYWK